MEASRRCRKATVGRGRQQREGTTMTHLINNRSSVTINKPLGEPFSGDDAFRRPDSYARRIAPARMALLPGPNDLYQAGGFADSEVSRLVLVMARKDAPKPGWPVYFFLQYMYIGLGELAFTEKGQVFRFIFSDIQQPKLVTVSGHNLTHICDAIAQRRLEWIRQAGEDFRVPASGKEPIITRIEIGDWRQDSQLDSELMVAACGSA